MRKLIAGLNMTLDGFCDHTAMIPDEEIHEYYSELLDKAGLLLYGRKTYQLMESYWPSLVESPTGTKTIDDFAKAIDRIPKIVYSRTLAGVSWKTTTLKRELSKEAVLELKQQEGKPILAGSPGMIVALSQMGLIDEYQLCVMPTILGSGLTLFKNISERIDLKLLGTRTFGSGVVAFTYERIKKGQPR